MKRSAIRELLKVTAQPGMLSFAGGLPAEELFPVAEILDAFRSVLDRVGPKSLQYGETEGTGELRDWVAQRFANSARPLRRENVMITSGAQQALDLIGRVFLDPGDHVVVEQPTYLALLAAWRSWGVRFQPVRSDAEGMCVDEISVPSKGRSKLVYCVPNFQNPQGTTLSLERRVRLLEKAEREDLVVVEDDPYGELRFSGAALPSLLELESFQTEPGLGRVVSVGTLSKVLVPGLRIGWVIAHEEVIGKLALAKQSVDLHTSTLGQYLAGELVRRGILELQIPRLRAAYRCRRDCMIEALQRHFPRETTWTRPDGGMFLMVTLPEGLDATALLEPALERGVAFVPGIHFFLAGGGNTMRLNFTHTPPDGIEEGIRRLGDVLVRQPELASL